jgi:hypothetical protein
MANGEFGYEDDTDKLKIGDGATAWTSLGYFSSGGGGGVTSVATSNGTFVDVTGGTITSTGTITGDLSATGTPNDTKFLRGDNVWATPAGSSSEMTVVDITSGTSSTIPNDGTDYLIGMDDYDPGDNYLLTIPRPSDVDAGRRFQFWLRNTSSYYFAVQTSDSSDLFQTSYDRYNGYGAFQYLETYLYDSVIFTIYSDGLATWYSDNAAYSGNWYGVNSPS